MSGDLLLLYPPRRPHPAALLRLRGAAASGGAAVNFELRRPCSQCPFRRDVPGFLHPARAEEIADALLGDQTFACHKTVDYDEDDGEGQVTSASQHCAGASIVLEKMDRPNQMMRIAERLRFYDRRKLDMDAPVFDDLDEFIDHHAESEVARA